MAYMRQTEAAPRHVDSSSSARCLYQHDLCTNGQLRSVLNKKALNLSDLNIPSVDNGYQLIARDSAAAKDLHVGKYVKRLLPSNLNGVEVHVDLEIDQFQQYLRPFMKSVVNRLDVVFLIDGLPLLIVEVQSSPFHRSVSKTVVGLIDQLRLHRNYNTEITQCTGFTFPEYKDKECVAKVCIKWSKFSFYIEYTPLTSVGRVQQEVALAITKSLKFVNLTRGLECDRFFIALSKEELSLVGRCVSEPIQCQVSSRQSIVLQGRDHFWKYNPDTRDNKTCL